MGNVIWAGIERAIFLAQLQPGVAFQSQFGTIGAAENRTGGTSERSLMRCWQNGVDLESLRCVLGVSDPASSRLLQEAIHKVSSSLLV